MRRRGFGLLLILTLIIAAGTLVQDYRFDNAIHAEQAAAQAADRDFGTLEVLLAEHRAAQAGYVAAGQGPEDAMTRAARLADDIEAALERRSASRLDPHTQGLYNSASEIFGRLRAIDARVRAQVDADQRLIASDLIFMDAADANRNLAGVLAQARSAERAAADARMSRLSRLRLGINGIALGFALIVAAFYARAAGRRSADAEDAAAPHPEPAGSLSLRPLVPPVPDEAESAAVPAASAALTPAREPDVQPAVDPIRPMPARALSETAELCVDLSRVIDARDLQSLLERAAGVLDAKGLVLWTAESGGALLRPSLTHGYPERVLMRLGPLQIDADNMTSLAYRSMRPQTVHGSGPGTAGAIAVPLVTPQGCVGVLSAELHQHQPGPETLSVARIISAQLSALVSPAESSAHAAQG
jgi:hypothetical protein